MPAKHAKQVGYSLQGTCKLVVPTQPHLHGMLQSTLMVCLGINTQNVRNNDKPEVISLIESRQQ